MGCKCGHDDEDHSSGKYAGCERCECYVTPEQQRDRYRKALERTVKALDDIYGDGCYEPSREEVRKIAANAIDEANEVLTSRSEPPGS